MNAITSNSMRMMERSSEFLWAKQAAHLDNIANAETPGYNVKTVTFEERFRSKMRAAKFRADTLGIGPAGEYRKAIEKSRWQVWDDEEVTRMDENGVNATEQAIEAVRTAYQLQYVYQAISSDLTVMNRAITA